MGSASNYWRLVELSRDSQRQVRKEELLRLKSFFREIFTDFEYFSDVPDVEIQKKLLQNLFDKVPKGKEDSDSVTEEEASLRCFISSQIELGCKLLANKYGIPDKFDQFDLLSLVLYDTLEDYKRQRREVLRGFKPLSITVLESFDIKKKVNLSTWTITKLKECRDIKDYLRQFGILQRTDWGILNQESCKSLTKKLTEVNLQDLKQAQYSTYLLEAFQAVYHPFRRSQIVQNGKQSQCTMPTPQQLSAMKELLTESLPHLDLTIDDIRQQLQNLAAQLRQYQSGSLFQQTSLDGVEEHIKDRLEYEMSNAKQLSQDVEEELAESPYIKAFLLALEHAVIQVIETRVSQDVKKKELFLNALNYLHCQGKSMGEIAPLIGMGSQSNVSRLLKLKEFHTDIRHAMIPQILEQMGVNATACLDPEQILKLDREINEDFNRLVKQAQDQLSTKRENTNQSLLGQYICRYLQTSVI
jgi:hypothetical protein